MRISWFQRCRVPLSLLAVGIAQRLVPGARAEDPTWFKLNGIPEVRAGLEMDGSTESDRINGATSTYDTLFITPTAGLRTSGSVYHPNLLAFDFDGEMGWGWDQMRTTSPGYSQTINESDELNRYILQVNLLDEKPYNASFFASEDHTYRDYGSFDTFTVDSSRYGGRMNWDTEYLNLNTDFGYRDETDTGLVDSSEVAETYFNFLGINKRPGGQTTLTARWDTFDNTLNYGSKLTSMNESVGISDAETFGSRQQISAATGASFMHAEYGGQQQDTINANENVNITHSRTLESFLLFNFEQNYLHPSTETYAQGEYGLRHQLYDSLTSTWDVHGSHQEDSESASSGSSDLYGSGLAENYVKRLQSWGRLSLGTGIVADHHDDSSTGDMVTSADETHQLYLPTSPQYRPVYLNHPHVTQSSIQVLSGGQVLVASTDYELITSGDLTEVRLIAPASSHLQGLLGANDNLSVSVSYESESANNAAYESLTSNSQIRLDLYGCFGIYGRLNWQDNNAPPTVTIQTLTDLVGGVDYHWRWFRTGAEYEDYDSNFSQYTAYRFYQSLDFQVNNRSSLGINFNETFYDYTDSGTQTFYQFTTRYNVQLWSSLSCYVQGGFAYEDVLKSDQVNGSAQAGFSWTRGKLSVRTGYEYNSESTSSGSFSEDREKHRLFVYLKRAF